MNGVVIDMVDWLVERTSEPAKYAMKRGADAHIAYSLQGTRYNGRLSNAPMNVYGEVVSVFGLMDGVFGDGASDAVVYIGMRDKPYKQNFAWISRGLLGCLGINIKNGRYRLSSSTTIKIELNYDDYEGSHGDSGFEDVFACEFCGTRHIMLGAGAGPYHASLVCGDCHRHLKWIPKPVPGEQTA